MRMPIKPAAAKNRTGKNRELRSIKIGLYPEFKPTTPWIRLKGKWLAHAGFLPGQRVQVKVGFECLLITVER